MGIFFQNIKARAPCPEMLTQLGVGLWNEYFWKTPPGVSNLHPLGTPVVESWAPDTWPQSWDSVRMRQALVRRNLGAMSGVWRTHLHGVYIVWYLHRCAKCIFKYIQCGTHLNATKSKIASVLRESPHKITFRLECYFFLSYYCKTCFKTLILWTNIVWFHLYLAHSNSWRQKVRIVVTRDWR